MTIRLTLLLMSLVAFLGTSLAEEAWVLYFEAESDRHKPFKKFYYNRNSITEMEPSVYEVYHKKTSDDNDTIYSISQYWFDCTKMMMATGNYTTYVGGEEWLSGNLFKAGFYKLREPYGNITIDPEWVLMPIICNR